MLEGESNYVENTPTTCVYVAKRSSPETRDLATVRKTSALYFYNSEKILKQASFTLPSSLFPLSLSLLLFSA